MARKKPTKSGKSVRYTKKEFQALYEKFRREFSAADLQKYTEDDETVPMRQVLAELKASHLADTARKKKRA